MSLNTRLKLTVLAGTLALAAAVPAAFAQNRPGIHQDPGGAPDAPGARHTEEVMKKQSQPSAERLEHSGAASTGPAYAGFHTDPGGTPDAPAARHSSGLMGRTAPRSAPIARSEWPSVPAY